MGIPEPHSKDRRGEVDRSLGKFNIPPGLYFLPRGVDIKQTQKQPRLNSCEVLVMAEFDMVIKNGMVVDGTRAPRFRSDVGIKNGRIAKIGRIASHEGAKVVDAEGHIVAPGFIDLHTHYDAQIFWDPYLTISGYHGITSVVIGNCGFGFAPVRPKDSERAMLTMVRTEAIPLRAMQAAMPFDWESYPQFMDKLDQLPKGVNLLPYVPMNPVLGYVMGIEESKTGRMPTDDEHARMRRILHQAMDAGACGWSAQRLLPGGPSAVQRDFDGSPMNTDVMNDETCIEMARVLGERGEGSRSLPWRVGIQGRMPSTSRGWPKSAGAPSCTRRSSPMIASRIAIATR